MMATTTTELRWIGADAPDPRYVQACEDTMLYSAKMLADAITSAEEADVRSHVRTTIYREDRARYEHANALYKHAWRNSGRDTCWAGALVRGYAIIDRTTRHVYGITDATTLEDAIDEAWGMDIPFDEGIIAIPATELATV